MILGYDMRNDTGNYTFILPMTAGVEYFFALLSSAFYLNAVGVAELTLMFMEGKDIGVFVFENSIKVC
jgi:hypothetical protein